MLEDRPFAERLTGLIAASLFTAFTLLFFAPMEMIMTNTRDIWFSADMVVWLFALAAFLLFAALAGLGLILRGKLFNLYLSLLVGITLCLYLQGNFLNIDYGVLNSQRVRWERYGAYAVVNTAICLLITVLPLLVLYFSRKVWSIAIRLIGFGLVLVQGVTLVMVSLTSTKVENNYGFTYEDVFSFHSGENVLWIIEDWFDNDFIEPMLKEKPDALDAWEGFTYYPNTVGISAVTIPSVPEQLTGRLYMKDIPYEAYLKNAWQKETIFTVLKEQGYDMRALGDINAFDPSAQQYFSNYVETEQRILSYPGMFKTVLSLVCYRYMPHALKAGFWLEMDAMNWFKQETQTYEFYDSTLLLRMQAQPVDANFSQKTFRLIHFNGMHEGNYMTREAIAVEHDMLWPQDQSLGCIKILNILFEQMKAAGVYDNTTIIVAADHGHNDWSGESRTLYTNEVFATIPNNPILFVKPKGAAGAWKTSQAPAWLMDIAPTILQQTGYRDYGRFGTSILDIDEDTKRERLFIFENSPYYTPEDWEAYLCRITGDANDWNNWERVE